MKVCSDGSTSLDEDDKAELEALVKQGKALYSPGFCTVVEALNSKDLHDMIIVAKFNSVFGQEHMRGPRSSQDILVMQREPMPKITYNHH